MAAHPVPIVVQDDVTERFKLDDDALEGILSPLRDKAISVVSLAGAQNTGKSFLLDYLVHYCVNKCSRQWLDNGEKPPHVWITDQEGQAAGIYIWSQPFIFPTTTDKEVAVILMDTQGNFESDTSKKETLKIFALTLLASSVTVYNVSHDIREDDLMNLRTASTYAALAQQNCRGSGAFQKLMFLVRNWNSTNKHKYGHEGGQARLEQALCVKQDQKLAQQVLRQDLRQSFEELACFLMPLGGVGGVTEIFLEYLKKFVPLLLEPEGLVVKLFSVQRGIPASAADLVDLFRTYMAAFNEGHLVTRTTLGEEIQWRNERLQEVRECSEAAHKKALSDYKSSIDSVIRLKGQILRTSVLMKHHSTSKSNAIAIYDGATTVQYADNIELLPVVNEVRARLTTEIDEMLFHYIEENETNKHREQKKILQKLEDKSFNVPAAIAAFSGIDNPEPKEEIEAKDAPKLLFLACKPEHESHESSKDAANNCGMCTLLNKFEESLKNGTMEPLMVALKEKKSKVSRLPVRTSNTLTYICTDETITASEEELLSYNQVLENVGYTAPVELQDKAKRIIRNKGIGSLNRREESPPATKEKYYLAYTFNEKIVEICDALSAEEVYAMKTFIAQAREDESDLHKIAKEVSVITSAESLKASSEKKDAAFYYMILLMLKNELLNSIYTHQLEDCLQQAKAALDHPTGRKHIPIAVSQLRTYKIPKNPPGICIIFVMMEGRKGSEKDLEAVKYLFERKFNYVVLVVTDPSKNDVKKVISDIGQSRNMFYGSLVVWFMSHGDETHLHVKDGDIHRRTDLITPFMEIEWLKTKPKLFFIQACALRKEIGATEKDEFDDVKPPQHPSFDRPLPKAVVTNPAVDSIFADTLVCYATMWYQAATRNPKNGSLFVQALVGLLKSKGTETSIEEVLQDTIYYVSSISTGDQKQTPYYESSLRKKFVFPKKN